MTTGGVAMNDFLLHVDPIAPNVRRVLMFLEEKGIEIPQRSLAPGTEELKTPAYLAKNPLGQIPLLEGPGGFLLAESMAICRYVDERFPEPPLFGRETNERAQIHMWTRRMELMLFIPAVDFGHHGHPLMKDHFEQISAFAALCRLSISKAYDLLGAQLSDHPFVAGDTFSIADIVAYTGVELAAVWGCLPDAAHTSLARWKATLDERPSAQVARYSQS